MHVKELLLDHANIFERLGPFPNQLLRFQEPSVLDLVKSLKCARDNEVGSLNPVSFTVEQLGFAMAWGLPQITYLTLQGRAQVCNLLNRVIAKKMVRERRKKY